MKIRLAIILPTVSGFPKNLISIRKMYLVILVAATALLGDGCNSATVNKHLNILSDLDNHIEMTGVQIKPTVEQKFLKLVQRPLSSYAHQGSPIHLVCDALGSPAPSIHWFKNDAPVYEFDMESNELIDANPSSVARVSATLIVTKASDRDVYTCLAASGSRTVRTTTAVYGADGSTDITERSKLYPLTPQIVVWYKVYMDTIGNNVVIPCRAKGHPRPRVSWRNNKGHVVKNDPRMKVLRSGELVISSLRWNDMGEYVCHATNMFGTTMAKTFLYPAKAG